MNNQQVYSALNTLNNAGYILYAIYPYIEVSLDERPVTVAEVKKALKGYAVKLMKRHNKVWIQFLTEAQG